ncbi:MAG: EamA family transporter [Mesorhizobium sp.]|nr:EamA family transporter [Mesorhizobium sp.]
MSSTNGPTRAPAPGAVEYALLAALSLAWGTSYMFTKIAVGSVPPFTLIAARTLIATAAMLLLMRINGKRLPLSRRDLAAFALVGLAANGAPLTLIAISVSHVDSSVTATTMALVPLITALYAVFWGDYPTPRNIAGIAVGLAGIAVLFGPEAFLAFGDSTLGAGAAISASIIFSASLFLMALVRHHDAMTVTTMSLGSAALWTMPVALFVDGVPSALPTAGVLAAVMVLALWNTATASLLMFALVPRAGATFTAYNNYLVPAVAVLCGTVFLGEAFTLQMAGGVGLVLAGVAISTFRRRQADVPLPPAV